MEKIPLREYVKRHGQLKTARDLGVSQGAVSKALITGRNIYVFHDDGKLKAEEVRKFPALPKTNLSHD